MDYEIGDTSRAEVSAEARVTSSSPVLEHVVVRAHVSGGPRYTLSDIRLRNLDSDENHLAFSAEELRALIPLHDGDVFSVGKVREGLDALRRYYGSHGYIDFVAAPETPKFDEMHQQIALVVSLQEGIQFRLGNIEVVGLDPPLEKELRSKIKPGETLNLQLIIDFYRDHKSALRTRLCPKIRSFIAITRNGQRTHCLISEAAPSFKTRDIYSSNSKGASKCLP